MFQTAKKQKNIRNIDCGEIQGRCIMKRLIQNVMKFRQQQNNMHVGQLGPVAFVPMPKFLKLHAPTSNNLPTCRISRSKYQRLVCIGDIHGDLLALLTALFVLNVIDHRACWNTQQQNTIVVICGDVMDRTRHVVDQKTRESKLLSHQSFDNPREEVDVIQYLHALNMSAMGHKGRVICLLGNHEVCTSFPSIGQCNGMQQSFQNAYYSRGWVDDGTVRTKSRTDTEVMQDKMDMFAAGEKFGRYMAVHYPLVLVVGDFILVHGGINIHILNQVRSITKTKESKMLTTINKLMSNWLFTNKIPSNFTASQQEQLQIELLKLVWNRELSQAKVTDATCAVKLEQVFQSLGLDWDLGGVVVGHTIQPNLTPTCSSNGVHKVWRVDLALSEAFGIPTSTGGIIVHQKPQETVVHTHQFKKKPRNCPYLCEWTTFQTVII